MCAGKLFREIVAYASSNKRLGVLFEIKIF